MGAVGLLLSISLLGFVAARFASRCRVETDRFWVFIAAVTLQIGGLTLLSSALYLYRAVPIVLLQLALAGATMVVVPRVTRFGVARGPASATSVPWVTRLGAVRGLIAPFLRDRVCLTLLVTILILVVLSGARQA